MSSIESEGTETTTESPQLQDGLTGREGMLRALDTFADMGQRVGRSIMHAWVSAVVTRHWDQCHRMNDQSQYVTFYIRPRFGSSGANATWYKNKHSKRFKTFQNAAMDIKSFADPLSPTNNGTDVNISRFKGASDEELAEIQITEEEMRLVRRAQKHLKSIRGNISALRVLLEKSEMLEELSELGVIDFRPLIADLPPLEDESEGGDPE